MVQPEAATDMRGSFARLYCQSEFTAAGIEFTPVQVNLSRNPAEHTLRGVHYQEPPRAEAKLVQVTRGSIHDVAATLLKHLVVHRQNTVQHAFDVDVGTLIPGGPGGLMISIKRQRHDAGIVDHDIDLAKLLNRGRGQGVHLC